MQDKPVRPSKSSDQYLRQLPQLVAAARDGWPVTLRLGFLVAVAGIAGKPSVLVLGVAAVVGGPDLVELLVATSGS